MRPFAQVFFGADRSGSDFDVILSFNGGAPTLHGRTSGRAWRVTSCFLARGSLLLAIASLTPPPPPPCFRAALSEHGDPPLPVALLTTAPVVKTAR